MYNVYHNYDTVAYPINDLNKIKIKGTARTNNLTDAQMTPLLNNYKGGCE